MKISSKLKKIMSFLLVTVLVMSVVVLPVSADTTKQVTYPAGTYPDNSYHPEYEYFGNCPVYTSDELVYTGEKSTDLMSSFNLVQQYDMSFCKNSGFYMSRPFEYRSRWDHGQPAFINFGSADSAYNQMFTKTKFDSLTTDFVSENNIDMDTYDIYYLVYQDYSPTREYGYLYMDYICVPKNSRIAISNENKPDGSKDSSEIHYGLVLPASYKSVFYVESYIDGETKTVKNMPTHFAGADFWNFLGKAHHSTIATNIPIFTLKADADMYVTTGKPLNDPSNKIPDGPDLGKNDRLSADSFGWKSFDCELVQYGDSYRFIYKYSPSVADMQKNPSSYYFDCEYSQNVKYKIVGQTVGLYETKSGSISYRYQLDSGGTTISDLKELSFDVYNLDGDGLDDNGNAWNRYVLHSLLGGDFNYGSADILSSYVYVTVVLKHKRFNKSPNRDDSFGDVLCDVSSDVRWFKFDALTGKKLDSSEVGGQVITKDSTDSDGNVITDSNGKPVKEVSQIITNDNSSHTTINNYYYNGDGKQSTSPDGSDTLSNILSALIKFIKTLVTEGLPAALEILKTLISSITGIVSDALNNINIGSGTTNGILAVFKALPPAMWSLLLIGILVLVVVGILNRIF